MRQKLAKYNQGKNPAQNAPSRPPLKSKAMRAPQDASSGQGETISPAEEAKLTTEQITAGVEQAKAAVNAPPLDLLAFEEALKHKHQELQAAGITPVLNMPKTSVI